MEYISQTSKDIRYCLSEGKIDESQFEVLDTLTDSWKGIALTIHVLGESHFITIKSENSELNEICACTDIDTGGNEAISNGLLKNLENEVMKKKVGDISYEFRKSYARWDEGTERLNACIKNEEVKDSVHEIGFVFPKSEDDLHYPLTKVFIESGNDLVIRTFHTYPTEHVIVETTSTIRLIASSEASQISNNK